MVRKAEREVHAVSFCVWTMRERGKCGKTGPKEIDARLRHRR